PYLVPDLPDKQKEALHYLVKVPLVYASVGIRDWKSFAKLKVQNIYAPASYWTEVMLNPAVSIGDYKPPSNPAEATLLALMRSPCKPGLPVRQQQIAGRYELLRTSFETFERNTREQLARMLRD